jgi:hypothetical protein
MRVQQLVLGLVALAGYAIAAPAPLDLVVRDSASVDDCPGYEASNVEKTDSSITADLTLAGDACNVYSNDLKDLKLLVEYQSSKLKPIQPRGGSVDTMLCFLGQNWERPLFRILPSLPHSVTRALLARSLCHQTSC